MSLDPEIRDQAYQFFVAEAPELLQTIESGILTLREDYNTAKVHGIMRAAHSLKGGAAGVGLEGIKLIAHRLEDIFKALYHAEDKISPEFERKLLHGYDCLQRPLTKQIETGSYDAEAAVQEAESVLRGIEDDLGDAMTQSEDYIPSSQDLGVDMASSIFEVDVEQGLEHLRTVIAYPEQYEVLGEVRAQAEVFTGLAEIMGLAGFGEIANSAIAALDRHPEAVIEITNLMIEDLEAGRNAFLNGDRAEGGKPSAALLAYTETEETTITLEENTGNDTDSEEIEVNADDLFGDLSEEETSVEVDNLFGDDTEEITINLKESAADTVNADDLFGGELETEEETGNADEIFGDISEEETTEEDNIPTNLNDAITAINENFSDLPPAQNLPTPPIPKAETETTPTPQPETKKSPKKSSQPSIRVDVERLQAMDNQLGELVIQRNSLAVQNEQLQRELRELLNRFSRFQNLVGRLQEFSDQEVIRESTQNQSRLSLQKQETDASPISEQPESVLDIDFDSLELDQYGALNAILQELLEETAQIEESVGDVSLFADQSNQTLQGQRKMLEQLRDELIWARMLPLSNILDRFPRILRDFSDQYDKPTRLSLEGTGVRVDKSVLEKLYDPLTHLIRNAFDHGIESAETREQNRKPAEGEIAIRAYYQGNQTVIEISDDGGGIDVQKVKAKALQTGLLSEDQAERFSKERLYNLLFEPGFSTAKEVTDLSGRGVGLDVVRDQLQALKGSISLHSQLGKGTTFVLSLPTTQSMAKLLIVLVDTTIWALPSDNIEQIIVPTDEQVKNTGKQRFLWWEDQAIPIYSLSDLLDYNCPVPAASPDLQALGAATQGQNRSRPLLILKRGEQRYPLELDRVITEQELVIKSLGSAISPPEYVSGCTILGDGRIVPVMDVFALLQSVQQTPQTSVVSPTPTRSLSSKIPTILVVDDSATQRQTLTFSLQRAGYQVLQAGDGREAISMLERYPDTNLVVCDIEMPNLNGFEFLRYRRQNTTLNQIPVVMLTSRSSEKHRKLCTHLGANHYFTKPYLEKDFIGTLKTIIDQ